MLLVAAKINKLETHFFSVSTHSNTSLAVLGTLTQNLLCHKDCYNTKMDGAYIFNIQDLMLFSNYNIIFDDFLKKRIDLDFPLEI